MKFKLCESGRSMVEMMGYMAVAMTIIVAVGKMVTSVFNEHKLSQASLQLGDLAVAISKAGAMEKDYSAVDLKKFVPTTYRVAGNKIFHVFGGEVKVAVVSDDPSKFSVTYKNLRRRQCIEIAMKDWRHNQSVDLYAIGINNNFLYWPVYSATWNEEQKVSETHVKRAVDDGAGGTAYAQTDNKDSLPMTRAKLTGTGENDNGLCSLATGNTITWIFN